jgi:hypothetical protein
MKGLLWLPGIGAVLLLLIHAPMVLLNMMWVPVFCGILIWLASGGSSGRSGSAPSMARWRSK